jgi:hypothetical protein
MNGHSAIDSTGRKWIRNSAGRIYTHCIVISHDDVISHAEWAGRPDLAAKVAASWRGETHYKTGKPYTAEVIVAVCTPGKREKVA